MITDKLRSAWLQTPGHAQHGTPLAKGLNNRAEKSYLIPKTGANATGFRSVGPLQHLALILSAVQNLFVPTQTNRSAAQIRTHRRQAMAAWEAVSARPA
ncbi:hypothetical protein [Mesorhizobium sp. M0586]|uniref:hypothetical protein n=1 Tax=unclassified Mesorhizobium TaxID=325217 RepID=UPI00333A75CD